MDFKDKLKGLAERIKNLTENFKEKILTEEATKNAFILPFIQLLGYDVFNPCEVIPELDCDIARDKGEKIDYAIMQDDKPVIVIECKHWQQNLDNHYGQLKRYFGATIAIKFGILTNGIIYRFYTDVDDQNVMDATPFLEIDMLNLNDDKIEELQKFRKGKFNIDDIKTTASDVKYLSLFKERLKEQLTEPSWDFVRFLSRHFYERKMTGSIYEKFKEYTKKSFNSYLSDIITEAVNNRDTKIEEPISENKEEIQQNKIVTTMEELEAFYIIKYIVKEQVPTELIKYRDNLNYFTIYIDRGYRIFVRLHFFSWGKSIEIVNKDRSSTKYKIENIEDIYKFKEELLNASKI